MRYKAPKITDEGLTAYLERTAAKHRGKTYNDLADMINAEVSPANIARMFGVDYRTAKNYIKIYHDEKKTKLSSPN